MEFFNVYNSYIEAIETLSESECGRLFRALLIYNATGEVPEFKGSERYIFPMMKSQIDRDAKAYEAKCQRNAQAARKRWANASNPDANDAAVCERIQTYANTNTNTNTNTSTSTNTSTNTSANAHNSARACESMFDEFWNAYPRKANSAAAYAKYMELSPSPELHAEILAAVERLKASEQWREDGGRYIPHPARFIDERRWTEAAESATGRYKPTYDRAVIEQQLEREWLDDVDVEEDSE